MCAQATTSAGTCGVQLPGGSGSTGSAGANAAVRDDGQAAGAALPPAPPAADEDEEEDDDDGGQALYWVMRVGYGAAVGGVAAIMAVAILTVGRQLGAVPMTKVKVSLVWLAVCGVRLSRSCLPTGGDASSLERLPPRRRLRCRTCSRRRASGATGPSSARSWCFA